MPEGQGVGPPAASDADPTRRYAAAASADSTIGDANLPYLPRAPPRIDADVLQKYLCRAAILVACVAALFVLTYGAENGTGPCALTAQQETFNVTVTEVTLAYSLVEASKVPGSLLAGYLAHFPHTLSVQMVVFAGVWAIGMVIIGSATSVWMMAGGYLVMGLGIAVINVAQPPLIDHIVPSSEKHRAPLYYGVIAAMGIVGIALGYVVCGATIETSPDAWRWNFYIGAMLAIIPCTFLLFFDAMLKRTRKEAGIRALGDEQDDEEEKHEKREMLIPWPDRAKMVAQGVFAVFAVPAIRWTILSQSAGLFAIAAYAVLVPLFIERGLGHSKATAGLVLAAIIPVIALATWGGGIIVKKQKWSVEQQLKFALVTVIVATPMSCVFLLTSLAAVAPLLAIAMIAAFLRTAPSVTLIAQASRRAITEHDDDVRRGAEEDEDARAEALGASPLRDGDDVDGINAGRGGGGGGGKSAFDSVAPQSQAQERYMTAAPPQETAHSHPSSFSSSAPAFNTTTSSNPAVVSTGGTPQQRRRTHSRRDTVDFSDLNSASCPPAVSTPDSYPVVPQEGDAGGGGGGGGGDGFDRVNTEPFTDDPTIVEHAVSPGPAAGGGRARDTDDSVIQYSQQEGGDDSALDGSQGSSSSNTPRRRSPHMSARDMERVATLTAYANGVGYFCSRVFGSIPGPIVLAAIIDGETVSIGVAFTLVGVAAGVVAAITAALALWDVGPCHSALVDDDDDRDTL